MPEPPYIKGDVWRPYCQTPAFFLIFLSLDTSYIPYYIVVKTTPNHTTMIRKIQAGEYMNRLTSMTLEEKTAYGERVEHWLKESFPVLNAKTERAEARFQNIIQFSIFWNDSECAAFDEGAKLLTAIVNIADTWLPDDLYDMAAKRVVRKMRGELAKAIAPKEPSQPVAAKAEKTEVQKPVAAAPKNQEPEPQKEPAAAPENRKPQAQATGGAPVRPKHIDQYVHLLPEKTQQKAAQVKGLLDQLDAEREAARLLMDGGDATARARHMTAATKIDNQLKAIYKELDSEWDSLVKSGKVVVDELGNAHVVETKPAEPEKPVKKKEGQKPVEQKADEKPAEDEQEKPDELSDEARKRVRSLSSFLKDTRRGNGKTKAEHVKKWKAAYKELVSIAGKEAVTDKIKAAAKHYGIKV